MIGGGAFNRGMIPRKQNPVAVPSTLGSQVSEPVQAPQRPPQPPAQQEAHVRPPSTPRQGDAEAVVESAGDIFVSPQTPHNPNGPRIAVIGRFRPWPWGQWPDEAYMADALEESGCNVYRIDQETEGNTVKEAEAAIFTGHPGSWTHLPSWKHSHFTALWTLDLIPGYPDRLAMMEMGKQASLFITSDKYPWKEKYDINNHKYMPGACEGITPPFRPVPVLPCAFLGTIYNDRRKNISRIVKNLGGTVIDKPGKWLYQMDLAKFVQTTKVIVGDNSKNDVPGYWSTRNYIIPGAGGFLLTAEVPGLSDDFAIGTQITTYKSLNELEGTIKSYIDDDTIREKIRRNGFFHVRSTHTWSIRAKTMMSLLGIKISK